MDTAVQDTRRSNLIPRLRRVEGQIRGVQRMIDTGETCENVARQLTAARRALDRAFYEMVACSMEHELETCSDAPEGRREAVAIVTGILSKYG